MSVGYLENSRLIQKFKNSWDEWEKDKMEKYIFLKFSLVKTVSESMRIEIKDFFKVKTQYLCIFEFWILYHVKTINMFMYILLSYQTIFKVLITKIM